MGHYGGAWQETPALQWFLHFHYGGIWLAMV